jgi:hypothetical protein
MSLKQWADNGWLKPHRTSRGEISNLLNIVERDLNDAGKDISADWRFGIAYNAALKLCTVLLSSEGYRPVRELQHYRTLAALTEILGKARQADFEYLNDCRKKRNIVEYDFAGGATSEDVEELIEFVQSLRRSVLEWMEKNHPDLM